jgi:hypothetical protein
MVLPRLSSTGNFESYEEDKKRRLGEDAVLPKRIKYKKFARA